MAYTINLTDGNIFAVISDGTINTSSSMTLVGKNYAGYGQFLDDNFIRLLENGANTTAPGAPLTGQLWWDKTTNTLKTYNGTVFKTISGATASTTAPVSNAVGDLWWDTTNAQLKVWSGAAFVLIGPAFTAGTGTSGAIVDTITDNTATSHVVVKLYVNNQVVGIVSKDAAFTPQVGISGYTTIRPGITLATTISGVPQLFQGTATDSQLLDGLNSTDFMSAISNTSTTGTVSVLNNSGLSVGVNSDARLTVAGTDVYFRNQTQNGNIILQVNTGGVTTTVGTIYGSNSVVNFGNALAVGSIAHSAANGVGNIGSSSSYFNQVFAQATTALYADVAERFASDVEYAPGTVVELGGSAEITQVTDDASDRVFGVISTRPAFTMNGGAGTDITHPAVAMTGRVPVKTIGAVRKGDRLVSAGNGMARAASKGEATAFNVIGRALVDKLDSNIGTVEAIVTIK
jgi:hypothetical protein